MAKTDLRLLGEIDKRVSGMQPPTKSLLIAALEDGVPASEVEIVRQVVERFHELSDEGQEYADKKLGVDREQAPAAPVS